MLQLSAAGKRFGHKLLFDEVNWLITPKERTGLVGGNGTGKSTLLKVLAGFESLDYGQRTHIKGMTLGYLPQDGLALSGCSVFDECLSVFDELRALEAESELLTHTLSDADPKSAAYAAAADRYSEIADVLHANDIYTLDAQVGAVLGGLGFSREDWERRTEEFSGGWQMRIALAKLLLQKPSLLLLDEPTNHLDLESRNWLEEYLQTYENAFILISHDRYFLDQTVSKTVEVWNKRMHVYHGNYSKYLTLKDERRAQLMSAYKNQRERIEDLEAFINRFRAQATKAKQVQSRIKELDKIERIEVPDEEATIHFSFPQPPASGRTVLDVRNLTKHYPMPDGSPKRILEDVSFTIDRGDRIALVGVNGAGKSTLLRMLSGQEAPTSGDIKVGHNVLPDFFAQDQYKVLDSAAGMLDDITGSNPRVDVVTLRSLLGCFMFTGDDVFKKLGVLSGGERNRYAMAKMLVSPANFLLLDEPTNHLDMRAKDVLLDAVRNFSGTVLFVSHDRYFIDGLATRVFEVEDRRVHIYPGGYEDYLFRKGGGLAATAGALAAQIKTDGSTGAHIDAATGMLKPVKQVGAAAKPEPEAAILARIAEAPTAPNPGTSSNSNSSASGSTTGTPVSPSASTTSAATTPNAAAPGNHAAHSRQSATTPNAAPANSTAAANGKATKSGNAPANGTASSNGISAAHGNAANSPASTHGNAGNGTASTDGKSSANSSSSPNGKSSGNGSSPRNGAAPNTSLESLPHTTAAHEIDGSLAPVTPTPKHEVKRLNPYKLHQLEQRVAAIEEELPQLEARIDQASQQQANYTTPDAARALVAELGTLRDQHTALTAEWETLATQLEEQTTA